MDLLLGLDPQPLAMVLTLQPPPLLLIDQTQLLVVNQRALLPLLPLLPTLPLPLLGSKLGNLLRDMDL